MTVGGHRGQFGLEDAFLYLQALLGASVVTRYPSSSNYKSKTKTATTCTPPIPPHFLLDNFSTFVFFYVSL